MTTPSQRFVIVGALRTAIGKLGGGLAGNPAHDLGAQVIQALLKRTSGLKPSDVDLVVGGCVLPHGQGQSPTRQALIRGGLPQSTTAIGVDRVCGSGIESIRLAMLKLMGGDARCAVALGMENMSRGPHMIMQGAGGMGPISAQCATMSDGLTDPYRGTAMGCSADGMAKRFGFTREEQDAFARASYKRALTAIQNGWFTDEIVPVTTPRGIISVDEEPTAMKLEDIGKKFPSFERSSGSPTPGMGTVTAGNASKINDGAAGVIVTTEEFAREHGLPIIAYILAYGDHALDPFEFTDAPIFALEKLFAKLSNYPNFNPRSENCLHEVNEAFACVTMGAMLRLGLAHERVNVHGGAVALGHPIGCSGVRIVVTLLHAMRRLNIKFGTASACIGGGQASGMAFELAA